MIIMIILIIFIILIIGSGLVCMTKFRMGWGSYNQRCNQTSNQPNEQLPDYRASPDFLLDLLDFWNLEIGNNCLYDRSFVLTPFLNGPKYKSQPSSGTVWFSYKIWTKKYKTPIVNLFKNLRPFWNNNYNGISIFVLFFKETAETTSNRISSGWI